MSSDDVQLRTDVEVLKRDFATVSGLFDRLDTTIEKLTDVSNSINRMLAVHENRLDQQDKEDGKLYNEIEKTRSDLTTEIEEQYSKIMEELMCLKKQQSEHHEKTVKRIETLENWRWYIVGAGTVVGFLLARTPFIHNLLGN